MARHRGVVGMEPLVTVTKFVIAMTPPLGNVKFEANNGVWVKVVTFVPLPLAAGLMETEMELQAALPVTVHKLVTLAAPGVRLHADKLVWPPPMPDAERILT